MTKPRIVPLVITDPESSHVEVISLVRKDGAEDMVGECHMWPVPPDDQLTQDLDFVTRMAADPLWDVRCNEAMKAEAYATVARVRAAYGLDQEEA